MKKDKEDKLANRVSIGELKTDFSEISGRVAYGNERYIVQKHSRDYVALVSIEDYELLLAILDELDPIEVRERIRDFRKKGPFRPEELRKELGLE